MRKERKWLVIVLAIMVTSCIVLYSMLTWRDNPKVKFVDSPSVNQKLKTAIMGDGVIELSEGEVNSLIDTILKSNAKLKGRVKESYINIIGDRIKINAVTSAAMIDFFISSLVKPKIIDKNMNLSIEGIWIGKVPVPPSLVIYFAKKYMPSDIIVLEDGSINLGSKVAALDIKDILISDSRVRIQLNDVEMGSKNNNGTNVSSNTQSSPPVNTPIAPPEPKPAVQPKTGSSSTANVEKPAAPSQTTQTTQPAIDPETQKKIDALKLTNAQMYNVLKEVKNSSGKEWVQSVINVNSKMINDPGGNYTNDINAAKVVYSKLPAAIKNEIKGAALNNMDVASVRYLVKVYGIS